MIWIPVVMRESVRIEFIGALAVHLRLGIADRLAAIGHRPAAFVAAAADWIPREIRPPDPASGFSLLLFIAVFLSCYANVSMQRSTSKRITGGVTALPYMRI